MNKTDANELLNTLWNALRGEAQPPTEIRTQILNFSRANSLWKEKVHREPAFLALVGSHNYGVAIEDSDLDFKAAYIPPLEDFYYGSFNKFDFVGDDYDVTMHPIQEFRRHMIKGNINFFEVLFSDVAKWNDRLLPFLYRMREIVQMNVAATTLSTHWTAFNCLRTAVTGPKYDSDKKACKDAAMAIRLLDFNIRFIETGEINLVPPEAMRETIAGIRRGDITQDEFLKIHDRLYAQEVNLVFKCYSPAGGKSELSDKVKELDKVDTPEWKELNKWVDHELMRVIRCTLKEQW